MSERQTQVLELIAVGHIRTDIARTLGISKNTLCTYIQRLFAALGADNAPHAVYLAMRTGFIK
jgi:DNA-binding NarL/FixJ family response regulator